MSQVDLPLFLTLEATAKECSVEKVTVERWVRNKDLPSIKIGGSRRVPRAALDALAAAALREAAAQKETTPAGVSAPARA